MVLFTMSRIFISQTSEWANVSLPVTSQFTFVEVVNEFKGNRTFMTKSYYKLAILNET